MVRNFIDSDLNIFQKFIFSSFIRPFFLTLSIVIVILLMQFLWKYIDDLIGKGLDWIIILELLWYSSITLIPMALPLAILLASMMLTGGLSEKSEITAINSLGQSFVYIMNPLLVFSLIICLGSFIISNYAIPYANLKTTTLMYDIMQKKLSINIKEKVFFSDIEGYSIRINEKKDNNIIEDIIIYDYTSKKGVKKIFLANRGHMSITNNNNYLKITLYNGVSYGQTTNDNTKYDLITNFEEYNLALDLSSFQMERTTSDRFSNIAKTMNVKDLKKSIESLIKERNYMTEKMTSPFMGLEFNKKKENTLQKTIQDLSVLVRNYKNKFNLITKKINKFQVELHRKITLAIACIIMLIIGAPIGAIIKKGGFGLPVIFSIFLFLSYHIISITGEKMVKKNIIDPIIGMWSPTLIMLTIGLLLIIIVNNNYFEKIWLKK